MQEMKETGDSRSQWSKNKITEQKLLQTEKFPPPQKKIL